MAQKNKNLNEQILRIHKIMGILENTMVFEAAANINPPNLKIFNLVNRLSSNPNVTLPTPLTTALDEFNKMVGKVKSSSMSVSDAVNDADFWNQYKNAGLRAVSYDELITSLNKIKQELSQYYRFAATDSERLIIAKELVPGFEQVDSRLDRMIIQIDNALNGKPLTKSQYESLKSEYEAVKSLFDGESIFIRQAFDSKLQKIEDGINSPISMAYASVKEKLEKIRNKAVETNESNNFWRVTNEVPGMSKAQYLRYWKYRPLVEKLGEWVLNVFDNATYYDKIKKFESVLEKTESEVPALLSGVISDWKGKIRIGTDGKLLPEQYINLDLFQTYFTKLTSELQKVDMTGVDVSSGIIDELTQIFKANPQFKQLPSETQELLEFEFRRQLARITPGSQPLWLGRVLDETVWTKARKDFKGLKGLWVGPFKMAQRYINTINPAIGMFKTAEEFKAFEANYNDLFFSAKEGLLIRKQKIPGIEAMDLKWSRYLYRIFIANAVFPLVWGITRCVFSWLLALVDGIFGTDIQPSKPEYDNAKGTYDTIVAIFNDFSSYIHGEYKRIIVNPITSSGGNPNEYGDSGWDYLLSFFNILVPYNFSMGFDALGGIISFVGYINSSDFVKDAEELINGFRRNGEEYWNEMVSEANRLKEEMDKLTPGTDEYNRARALWCQALIRIGKECEQQNGGEENNNNNNNNNNNQNGGGGTVRGDDSAPKVEGIDVKTKEAFDIWSSSNRDKNPKWIKMVGNVGEVEVSGKKVTCVYLEDGKFAITTEPPIIIEY